jgi:hypothetical protein
VEAPIAGSRGVTRLGLHSDGTVELDGYIGQLQKLDGLGIAAAAKAGEL